MAISKALVSVDLKIDNSFNLYMLKLTLDLWEHNWLPLVFMIKRRTSNPIRQPWLQFDRRFKNHLLWSCLHSMGLIALLALMNWYSGVLRGIYITFGPTCLSLWITFTPISVPSQNLIPMSHSFDSWSQDTYLKFIVLYMFLLAVINIVSNSAFSSHGKHF